MPGSNRIRITQSIREAEGYLELGMPEHALQVLERIEQPATFRSQVLFLKGDALRALERYSEAVDVLKQATNLAPSNIHIWLVLGMCYKRVSRIDLAVEALEQAEEIDPTDAMVQYNLACYLSLAGNKRAALAHLARAFELNGRYRDLVSSESDFDPIRSDPEFQAMLTIVV